MTQIALEPTFVADRKSAHATALYLLDRMKKGKQTAADFERAGEGALWAYARLKWAPRALLIFEALRQADQAGFLSMLPHDKPWRILSLGGGPGNDLHGALLFRQLLFKDAGTKTTVSEAQSTDTRLALSWVFDFAPQWQSIVRRLSNFITEEICWAPCDLTQPLCAEVNAELALRVRGANVIVCSYVLHEVGWPKWQAVMQAMWTESAPDTIFVVKDPNDRAERQLLAMLQQLDPDRDKHPQNSAVEYMWACGDCLILKKPHASRPSPPTL